MKKIWAEKCAVFRTYSLISLFFKMSVYIFFLFKKIKLYPSNDFFRLFRIFTHFLIEHLTHEEIIKYYPHDQFIIKIHIYR